MEREPKPEHWQTRRLSVSQVRTVLYMAGMAALESMADGLGAVNNTLSDARNPIAPGLQPAPESPPTPDLRVCV